MPGEVPTGWTMSPFSGVATVERGLTYSNEQECKAAEPGAWCVLRIPNVQQQRFAPHDLKYIRGVPAKQVQKYSVPRKSILMVGSNGNADRVGNCCFVDSEEQYLFASFLMRVVPDIAQADAQFFYYLIAGGEVQAAITDAVAGTTGLKNISLEMLRGYPLALPPLPEQKKIAAILSSVDEAIQATQAVIDQTRRVKEGLLQDLLTRGIGHTRFKQTEIGEIPEGWEVRSLGNVTEQVYVASPVEPRTGYFPAIVRRRHRGVDFPEARLGSDILVKEQYRVLPGSVLFSKRQLVHGATGLVSDDVPGTAIVSKEYFQLFGANGLLTEFLYLWTLTTTFQALAERCCYGVDREKFVVNEKWFFATKVPLPPFEEQSRITAAYNSLEAGLRAHDERLLALGKLRSGLLTDLLTGKVRVTP